MSIEKMPRLIAMAALTLLLAACAPPESLDAQFIDDMVEHHEGAIMMAEQALGQAEHAEILALAEAIIATQAAEIDQMETWREAWFPGLPPTGGMAGMDMGMMMIPDGQSPFDLRFIDAMIDHHQGAIDMSESILQTTERPELRALAEAIISAQSDEIAQMQTWRAEWFPEQ